MMRPSCAPRDVAGLLALAFLLGLAGAGRPARATHAGQLQLQARTSPNLLVIEGGPNELYVGFNDQYFGFVTVDKQPRKLHKHKQHHLKLLKKHKQLLAKQKLQKLEQLFDEKRLKGMALKELVEFSLKHGPTDKTKPLLELIIAKMGEPFKGLLSKVFKGKMFEFISEYMQVVLKGDEIFSFGKGLLEPAGLGQLKKGLALEADEADEEALHDKIGVHLKSTLVSLLTEFYLSLSRKELEAGELAEADSEADPDHRPDGGQKRDDELDEKAAGAHELVHGASKLAHKAPKERLIVVTLNRGNVLIAFSDSNKTIHAPYTDLSRKTRDFIRNRRLRFLESLDGLALTGELGLAEPRPYNYYNLADTKLGHVLAGDVYNMDAFGSVLDIYSHSVSVSLGAGRLVLYRNKDFFVYSSGRTSLAPGLNRVLVVGRVVFFVFNDFLVRARLMDSLTAAERELVVGVSAKVGLLSGWRVTDSELADQIEAKFQLQPEHEPELELEPAPPTETPSALINTDRALKRENLPGQKEEPAKGKQASR